MKKRIKLAKCDINLALECKETFPDVAKNQYNLSIEEMNALRQQHDQIVQIIYNYKKENKEVPALMQAMYDYAHEEYIEYATEIKAKQELFK